MEKKNKEGTVEGRVARIEGTLEQINNRLNHVESEIAELRRETNERFIRIENDMKTNFRWTIGIMITMWVTIILTIIFGV
jgi:C4-type Zn-finger protein